MPSLQSGSVMLICTNRLPQIAHGYMVFLPGRLHISRQSHTGHALSRYMLKNALPVMRSLLSLRHNPTRATNNRKSNRAHYKGGPCSFATTLAPLNPTPRNRTPPSSHASPQEVARAQVLALSFLRTDHFVNRSHSLFRQHQCAYQPRKPTNNGTRHLSLRLVPRLSCQGWTRRPQEPASEKAEKASI